MLCEMYLRIEIAAHCQPLLARMQGPVAAADHVEVVEFAVIGRFSAYTIRFRSLVAYVPAGITYLTDAARLHWGRDTDSSRTMRAD